jgi:hypothetical protein
MARGTTLGELITKLRIAARYDPNPALSKNMAPLFQQTLTDTQERLYDEFDWPFLKIQRDKELSAGERYYDVPVDMNLERIIAVDVLVGGIWEPVERGITLDHYSACNSDLDARRDPVERWDVVDTGNGEQIEVWPVPASNGGTLRFSGIRKLKPLIQNADKADIDDQLIVAFAAAEVLAGKNDPEAQLKLQQGNKRLSLLQGRVTKTRRNGFTLGGGSDCSDRPRGYPHGVTVVATQQT